MEQSLNNLARIPFIEFKYEKVFFKLKIEMVYHLTYCNTKWKLVLKGAPKGGPDD